METRTLGEGLTVSALGLGCMGFTHGYGQPIDEQKAIKAIRAAYEHGYRFFDTAEIYQGTWPDGSRAYNEELVGKALHEVRDQVVIASKFGITAHESADLLVDSRPATIRKAVEGSLKRLKTDHIDLYYQHRIDPQVAPEEVAQVMADLIKEGKITHWGISEANADYLRRADAVCKVTAVQNRYSMMYRDYEALFPVLEELKVGLVAFSPLANGLLTGSKPHQPGDFGPADLRQKMPQFTAEAYQENQQFLQLLADLAQRHEITVPQLSLAWMLNKKPYIVPIPGSRHAERIVANAKAATVKLTAAEVAQIDQALDTVPMSAVFGGTKVKN